MNASTAPLTAPVTFMEAARRIDVDVQKFRHAARRTGVRLIHAGHDLQYLDHDALCTVLRFISEHGRGEGVRERAEAVLTATVQEWQRQGMPRLVGGLIANALSPRALGPDAEPDRVREFVMASLDHVLVPRPLPFPLPEDEVRETTRRLLDAYFAEVDADANLGDALERARADLARVTRERDEAVRDFADFLRELGPRKRAAARKHISPSVWPLVAAELGYLEHKHLREQVSTDTPATVESDGTR